VFIFDEPTTGLHGTDVARLLTLFRKLIDTNSNTVVVIEHCLPVIACADYVIDMGPGGGREGGQCLVQGTPEQLALTRASITGEYLAPLLGIDRKDAGDAPAPPVGRCVLRWVRERERERERESGSHLYVARL
jgi:excinuclease ABC subunit A